MGAIVADWYYIGHYGQLGPLTREQIEELIQGGVIDRSTYVWQSGMSDWVTADRCPALASYFVSAGGVSAPPPPPVPGMPRTQPVEPMGSMGTTGSFGQPRYPVQPNHQYPRFSTVRSDRSRTAAGVLQLIIPGVGRMYLGYLAYGVLQLVLTFVTCGAMWIWSFIDGIIILTGGVKLDGYGRQLQD